MKNALCAVLLLSAWGCSKRDTQASAPVPAAVPARPPRPPAAEFLSYTTPPEWVSENPANEMRKAQYLVPDRQGKAGPASLALITFGAAAAGLETNVERWREQMGGGDASIKKLEGSACPVTLVDIAGSYAGDDRTTSVDNARLLVAIVEAGERTWYFKLVGPSDTVGGWKDAFVAMLKGVRPIE